MTYKNSKPLETLDGYIRIYIYTEYTESLEMVEYIGTSDRKTVKYAFNFFKRYSEIQKLYHQQLGDMTGPNIEIMILNHNLYCRFVCYEKKKHFLFNIFSFRYRWRCNRPKCCNRYVIRTQFYSALWSCGEQLFSNRLIYCNEGKYIIYK